MEKQLKFLCLTFIFFTQLFSYAFSYGCCRRLTKWCNRQAVERAAHNAHDANNGILLPNASHPFPAPVTGIILDYLQVCPVFTFVEKNDQSDAIDCLGFMDTGNNLHLLTDSRSPVLHTQKGTLTYLKQRELLALVNALQQERGTKMTFLLPGREELSLQTAVQRSYFSRLCRKKPALSLPIKRHLVERKSPSKKRRSKE